MILTGASASPGVATGELFVLEDLSADVSEMKNGQILVIKYSTPMYFEFFLKSKAIITSIGGITCHAASLARDLNIPCVVSVSDIFQFAKNGDTATVDANKGVIYVYPCNEIS